MKIHSWPNLVTANWAPRGKGLYLLYTPLFPQALALGLATVGIERIFAKSKWINEYYQQDKKIRVNYKANPSYKNNGAKCGQGGGELVYLNLFVKILRLRRLQDPP